MRSRRIRERRGSHEWSRHGFLGKCKAERWGIRERTGTVETPHLKFDDVFNTFVPK